MEDAMSFLTGLCPKRALEERLRSCDTGLDVQAGILAIILKKEVAEKRGVALDWGEIQKQILKETNLVDNKVFSITEEEYGTQFIIRRSFLRKSTQIKKNNKVNMEARFLAVRQESRVFR